MLPKYQEGMRVRIRIRDADGQILFRELERYESMTGVVLSSKAVVAYSMEPVAVTEQSQTYPPKALHMYKVKLEEGVTLDNLTEYCLEEV